jgi:hypothetical protein
MQIARGMKQGQRSQEVYDSWPRGSADFISVGTIGVDGEEDSVQRSVSTISRVNVELRPCDIHSLPARKTQRGHNPPSGQYTLSF